MIFFRLLNNINKKTNNRFYLFLGVLINIVITHIIIQNDMIFLNNNNNAHPVFYMILYIAIFVCVIITNILVFILLCVSYRFISWFKNDLLKATKEAIVEEFNIKSDKISDNTKSKISFK